MRVEGAGHMLHRGHAGLVAEEVGRLAGALLAEDVLAHVISAKSSDRRAGVPAGFAVVSARPAGVRRAAGIGCGRDFARRTAKFAPSGAVRTSILRSKVASYRFMREIRRAVRCPAHPAAAANALAHGERRL